ncbi:MAG: ribosomal small subunit methyltransferase, partial [Candidatus Parcubacteria bacterium]
RKFLLEPPMPSSVTVMVQREVADRILAQAGDMSALAVFVRTLGDASRVVNVPAGAFLPPPKVDSAVIHIVRKGDQALEDFFGGTSRDRYFSIVRTAFAGKRKQLKNSLQGLASSEKALNEAFLRSGIAPARRPEELAVEDWRALAAALN